MKAFVAVIAFIGVVCVKGNLIRRFPSIKPHLSGGDELDIWDQPFTVKVLLKNDSTLVNQCSGSRIDSTWVLTAAECFDVSHNHLEIFYVGLNGTDLVGYTQKLEKNNVTSHPKYNQTSKLHNLALLRCDHCEDLPKQRIPILPPVSDIYKSQTNKRVIITGYDLAKNETSDISYTKRSSLKARVVSHLLCKPLYKTKINEETHFCGGAWLSKGLCNGDSGTPMILRESASKYKLIGISSSENLWGCKVSFPMIFTKLSSYLGWISKTTGIELVGGEHQ